jgi:hypothetical protein
MKLSTKPSDVAPLDVSSFFLSEIPACNSDPLGMSIVMRSSLTKAQTTSQKRNTKMKKDAKE